MVQILDSINNSFTRLLQNQWFTVLASFLLILIASLANPQSLPSWIISLFENPFFRLFVLFCIAYTASKNVTVAILAAITYAVVMSLLSERSLREGIANNFK